MKAEKIDSVDPGNAFLSDGYNMGFRIGTSLVVMYSAHSDRRAEYVIVVDEITGERIRITV